MEQKKIEKLGRACLFLAPLFFGMAGFLLEAGEAFGDAFFLWISLYMMNFQDTPPNFWIELGRWTAPLASAGGILLAFAALRKRAQDFLCYRRGRSVAVYGPEGERQALLALLGREGIDGEERFIRAQRYILLGNEAENLAFYEEHRKELSGQAVYLRSESLPAQSVSGSELRLFCPEETAARLFWKRCGGDGGIVGSLPQEEGGLPGAESSLYGLSKSCGHRMRIVFLGFGRLGEELLKYGLQENIFSPKQRIEYHIFGKGDGFRAVHRQLGEMGDPVVFHGEPWYEGMELLEEAQMVIVLEQEDQLALLQSLLLATRRERFFVFAGEEAGVGLLSGRERLAVFLWRREAFLPERILEEGLFERAKRINLRYAALYGGVEETEENKEEEWRKLDAFTRYSNISAADYHEVRLGMLRAMGEPADAKEMPAECLELLAQLEHIRWCRYHYWNNWRYGVPGDGRRKDAGRRIHADLIPDEELGDGEKEKDRENIRVLLSVRL